MLADFIPQSFFAARADAVLWVLAAGAIALLVFGADRAVAGAARLASALGMSAVLIGATVVSLGTTSPEAAVSVTAALAGNPGLALGNGVGSIICDTALVFGVCCVMARLPLDRFVLHRHGVLKLATGALLTLTVAALALAAWTIHGVVIPRWVGFGYVVLLVGYLWLSVRWARQHPEIVVAADPRARPFGVTAAEARRARPTSAAAAAGNLLLVVFGLALVVGSSDALIGTVKEMCTRYRVPPDVLAVTLVALGTSLPELATAIASVLKGHPEIAIGNVIGADILNVLFVIGVSAAAVPLEVPVTFFYLHLPVMMIALALMGTYIFTSGTSFKRWQGVPLLALYAGYFAAVAVVIVGPGAGR
jgi:cation:H+ antiporter